MKNVLLFGEPMVMFVGLETGSLTQVNRFEKKVAGAELNVAIGLKRLGLNPIYCCRLANDSFGKCIEQMLVKEKISHKIFWGEEYTGFQFKCKTEDFESDVHYFRENSAASKLSKDDFDDFDFKNLDWVHITGIQLALSEKTRELTYFILEKCKEFKIPVSFDPNIRLNLWKDKECMISHMNQIAFQSDVFLPGIKEARILSGLKDEDEISNFYINNGTKAIVMKNGVDNVVYYDKNRKTSVPVIPLGTTVDTVGAGDGFAVGIIYSILNNFDINQMLINGSVIGSNQVTVEGDNEGLPTVSELNFLIEKRRKNENSSCD